MRQQALRLYEGMYVFGAHLGEEGRKVALNKIKEHITALGGEIHKVHQQGRRRLAYEIERHREGYYYLLYFSVAPGVLHELREEYQRTEDLLRFLILQTDEVMEELKFPKLPEL